MGSGASKSHLASLGIKESKEGPTSRSNKYSKIFVNKAAAEKIKFKSFGKQVPFKAEAERLVKNAAHEAEATTFGQRRS